MSKQFGGLSFAVKVDANIENPSDESCFFIGKTEIQVFDAEKGFARFRFMPLGKAAFTRNITYDKPVSYGQSVINLVSSSSKVVRLAFQAPKDVAIDRKVVRKSQEEKSTARQVEGKYAELAEVLFPQ